MASIFIVQEIHAEHRVMGVFDSIIHAINFMEYLPGLYQIERRTVRDKVPTVFAEDYRGGWLL